MHIYLICVTSFEESAPFDSKGQVFFDNTGGGVRKRRARHATLNCARLLLQLLLFFVFAMDKFEAINLDGSDVWFSLRQFDPSVSPVYDKIGAQSRTGAEIIQQVIASPRIKNAVTEVFQSNFNY